ncbi:MAG: hypothetical protein QM820_29830 [Minicystis sp.]
MDERATGLPAARDPLRRTITRLARDERARHSLAAVIIGVVAAVACGALRTKNLPLDDAYIHLSYGLDFSLRSLFSFQGFQRDTGTSSWTWTALCILVAKLRLPEHAALTALGIAIFCGVLRLVMDLALRALPRDVRWRAVWPIASALLVAANGNVIWLSLTGMETGLWVLLLLATIPRMLAGRGMPLATGLLALLAVWTRIETAVWLILAAALMPLAGDRGEPRARRGFLLPLGGLLVYLAYNHAVSGHLLPTTGLAKRASFIQGGHSLSQERDFVLSVAKLYARPHLPGWLLELVTVVVAGAALLATRARDVVRRRRIDPASAAVAALLAGAFAHAILDVIEFRSAYHHLRYFAPILYLVPAFSLTVLIRAAHALAARAVLVRITGRAWASVGIAITVTLAALALDLHAFRGWSALYVRNAEQLGAVHLAAGRWLREHAEPGARRVASFDIGALRWASGLEIVDLGGVLDGRALAYRSAKRQADFVRDARADYYVSIENGFDFISPAQPTYDLELIHSWQFREYFDPYPPHSKRMVLYRVNHCGSPRLERRIVGPVLTFDFDGADARAREAAGRAEGDAFARWPINARELGRAVPQAHGRFLASDAHPLRDRAVGRFETAPMRAEGSFLSFRIAGGHDPARLRVELRSGGAVQHTWTGSDTDTFIEIVHPLDDLRGRDFTLALVDESSGRWGHLLLDEVKQLVWREAPPRPCPIARAPARAP